MILLKAEGIDTYYGDLHVLFQVTVEVKPGEVVAILGANGAGKTTLVKTISGLLTPAKGRISFEGKDITHVRPDLRVEQGLVLVRGGVFPYMTVQENLEMGAYNKRAREKMNENLEKVYELFPRIKERRRQIARTLSGGERMMLSITKGLLSAPKLLMLDEPSAGLSPAIASNVFDTIEKVKQTGMTVLIIEHTVRRTLQLSDRAYVLDHGRVAIEGDAQELIDNKLIRQAYMGIRG